MNLGPQMWEVKWPDWEGKAEVEVEENGRVGLVESLDRGR